MGRAEYWDPTTQSRQPMKSGSIVDNTGLEYTPSDVKVIETTVESHKAESATIDELGHIKGNTNVDGKLKADSVQLEDIGDNFTAVNVEGAMSELFTNVSNGKDLVSGAITGVDDSVVIPTNPTFSDLGSAIGSISTGKKWVRATYVSSSVKRNFQTYNAWTPSHLAYYLTIDVVALGFQPCLIAGVETQERYSQPLVWFRDLHVLSSQYGKGNYFHGNSYIIPTNAHTMLLPVHLASSKFELYIYE